MAIFIKTFFQLNERIPFKQKNRKRVNIKGERTTKGVLDGKYNGCFSIRCDWRAIF